MTISGFEHNIYPKLKEFLWRELSTDCSGHNHQHALRVVKNAKLILQQETADYVVVVTAALLHDVIDRKLFVDTDSQDQKVRQLLEELNFDDSSIEQILYIMKNISFSSGKSEFLKTIEAKIVCDADRLDALGALGIIRTIEYGAVHGRAFYSEENLSEEGVRVSFGKISNTSLSHFYEKLLKLEALMFTDKGRELAQQRTCFMREFLEQFYEEVNSRF